MCSYIHHYPPKQNKSLWQRLGAAQTYGYKYKHLDKIINGAAPTAYDIPRHGFVLFDTRHKTPPVEQASRSSPWL